MVALLRAMNVCWRPMGGWTGYFQGAPVRGCHDVLEKASVMSGRVYRCRCSSPPHRACFRGEFASGEGKCEAQERIAIIYEMLLIARLLLNRKITRWKPEECV